VAVCTTFEHGHVQHHARAAGGHAAQGGEDGNQRRHRAPGDVGQREVAHLRRPVGGTRLLKHAGQRGVVQVVPYAVGIGAILAVAGQRAQHEPRVGVHQHVGATAAARQHAGAERL
jgi:hypothetical protein